MNPSSTEAQRALIEVGDPNAHEVSSTVLQAPGGFAWWYVDALDPAGDGAVLIWSYGLPFLPGYLSGARTGSTVSARARPSLNVALYQAGQRAFYSLEEMAPDQAEMDGHGNFRFGTSRILRRAPDQLEIQLDCAIPRSEHRLRGKLRLHGPPARLTGGLEPSSSLEHRWTPVLGPSRLEGHLNAGSEQFELNALAYHDRNEGTRRFDDLGIAHWIWGRLVTEDRTTVWYLCFSKEGPPVAWGVELGSDGTVHRVDGLTPVLEGRQRGTFGLATYRSVELRQDNGEPWVRALTGHRVDDGPFYARTTVEVHARGQSGLGLSEWIVPDRIDMARHRPLVRMTIHREQGPNSFWLPLFSGPRSGRVARLLGWTGARAEPAKRGDV